MLTYCSNHFTIHTYIYKTILLYTYQYNIICQDYLNKKKTDNFPGLTLMSSECPNAIIHELLYIHSAPVVSGSKM